MPAKPVHATVDPADGLSLGLRARWLLNEGAGVTLNDISGNGYDLSLVGSYLWVTTADGPAVRFDGGDGYAFISSNFGTTNSNATLWVRFQRNAAETKGLMATLGNSVTGFSLGTGSGTADNSGSALIGLINNIAWVPSSDPLGAVPRNGALVAPTSGTTTLYSGANPIATVNSTRNAISNSFYLGCGQPGQRPSSETIIEACVWSRLLTLAEISRLNTNPYAGLLFSPPAVASITPTTGPGGTQVVLTGADFYSITSVQFAGISGLIDALFLVDSATQITCAVPPGAVLGPIRVTNTLGTGTSAQSFTPTGGGGGLILPTNWSDA